MPYIALSLTVPTDKPVVHWLLHDLESLFLVLLHILGFWAEPGVVNNVETTSYRMSCWHTEANPKILLEDKANDLYSIFEDPDSFVTGYWCPITPYLKQLFKVVYPNIKNVHISDTTLLSASAFISVLSAALDFCKTLNEKESGYAKLPCVAPKKCPPPDMSEGGAPKYQITSQDADGNQMYLHQQPFISSLVAAIYFIITSGNYWPALVYLYQYIKLRYCFSYCWNFSSQVYTI